MPFEDFEYKALTELLACAGLEASLPDPASMRASVAERKFTGVGFMTAFAAVPPLMLIGEHPDRVVADVAALLNGAVEAGLMLKIEGNRIVWLEGYTFASERWPETLTDFRVYQDEVRQV